MRLFEELISPKQYPLQQKYDYYNNMLFQGQLPKIPVVWKPLKSVSGKARCRYIKSRVNVGGRIINKTVLVSNSLSIEMSNLFDRSEEMFDSVLIHEQLHIFFFTIGDFKEAHGYKFLTKCREFSSRLGFRVAENDEMKDAAFNGVEAKGLYVALITRPDSYSFAIISPNAWVKFNSFLVNTFERYAETKYANKVQMFIIKTLLWTAISKQVPTQNMGKGTFKAYKLTSKELLQDLLDNGQVIFST